MKSKTIYLLIGPKGSGKSYIGEQMELSFGIKFIRVEDWAKNVRNNRNVYDPAYIKEVFLTIEKGIRNSLECNNEIVFETTGLSKYFDQMLESLKKDFKVITIGIHASQKLCLQRIKSRDQSIHIPVSVDVVNRINREVRAKQLTTNYSIFNEGKSLKNINNEIFKIIKNAKST